MKAMYQTFEGCMHDSVEEARTHVTAIYADALLKLAHRLSGEKDSSITPILEASSELMGTLTKSKEDMDWCNSVLK